MNNRDKLQEFRKKLGYSYPPTLRKLCTTLTGMSEDENTLEQIIAEATPLIFNFTYPMFNENHKQSLEQKIIKRYFFREISCESVAEWQLRLDAKMNEIMPYYNKLYESVGMLTDIFDDVDYTREFGETTADTGIEKTKSTQNIDNQSQASGTSSAKSNDSGTNFNLTAQSDTPQGHLDGLLNNTYMSAAAKVDGTTSNNSESSESRSSLNRGNSKTDGTFDTNTNKTGRRDYKEKIKGKMYSGSKAKIVMEYRKAILNIDAEIIGRLSDLFMLTYHPYYEEGEDDD